MGRKTKQKVEIELVGGLGNQLFGYFAGAFYAQKFNKLLIVDLTQVSLGLTNHGSQLTSFKLSKSYELIRSKPRRFARLNKRISDKLSIKFKLIKYFRYKLFGVYQSKEVGFDSFLEKQSEISRIQGYYQTWKYVDNLQELEADLSLEIINPSNWFLELQNEINKVKPIVIHVRRGDYKNPNSPKYLKYLLGIYYKKETLHQMIKTIDAMFYYEDRKQSDKMKYIAKRFYLLIDYLIKNNIEWINMNQMKSLLHGF